jgi:hypothetical protein
VSAAASAQGDDAAAFYVYGVVARGDGADAFEGVVGVDPAHEILLIEGRDVAAVASEVTLGEFGDDVLTSNLRDPLWLEEKVRAHDRVLSAAVGRVTVVPFRFGTIYRSLDHVREMLDERADLERTLERLRGAVELGVKGFLSRDAVRDRLAVEHGLDREKPASGRAYMLRRSLERDLDEAVQRLAAEFADENHERLAGAAEAAIANPVRAADEQPEERMFLNGAYLVRVAREDEFRAAVASLDSTNARYEVTGPWPAYNFAEPSEDDA